jgi:tRNA (cytidine/uridine-2'-O-)-methyltransferase
MGESTKRRDNAIFPLFCSEISLPCASARELVGDNLLTIEATEVHIVLYQPEIPDNAGNIGRTCVALGAKLWLVRPLGFRLDDRHLRRAGLDYWQHLRWEAVEDWQALGRRLPQSRFWFFSKTATNCYADARFAPADALVFGSESQGLPQSLLVENPDRCLRIPMDAKARSLNLAVSVAVAAYEMRRQCGPEGDAIE